MSQGESALPRHTLPWQSTLCDVLYMDHADVPAGGRTSAARRLFPVPHVDAAWGVVRGASERSVVHAVLAAARTAEDGPDCTVAVWLEIADYEALVPVLSEVRGRIEGIVAAWRPDGRVRVLIMAGSAEHRGMKAVRVARTERAARMTRVAGPDPARVVHPAVHERNARVLLGLRLAGRPLLAVAGPMLIGRSVAGAGRVDDSRVSGRHCRLVPAGRGLRVYDLASRNGVRIDGDLIGAVSVAFSGSRLLIGTTEILVERVR